MTWRGLTSCQLPGGPLKSRWNKLTTMWTAQNDNISRCVAAGAPHSNWRVMMNSGAFKKHPLDPHITHQSTQQQPFEKPRQKGQQTSLHCKSLQLSVWPRKCNSNKLRQTLLQQKVGQTNSINTGTCIHIQVGHGCLRWHIARIGNINFRKKNCCLLKSSE